MDTIFIHKLNEVHCVLQCSEPHMKYELSEHFTFMIPNAKFHPKVKARVWDGKIRLFNMMNGTIYAGLVKKVESFAKARNYKVVYKYDNTPDKVTPDEVKTFLNDLNLPFPPRDYQLKAFYKSVTNRRHILLSPTGSGKSFIIYIISQWYLQDLDHVLVIVPTTSLVSQMATDFADYGYKEYVHQIMSGKEKEPNAKITVSTWQSIRKLPKAWFNQFDVVIGDEVHLFKAKSLSSIMEKCEQVKYRFGFTGSLDESETNKLVLEGLFGAVYQPTTTKEQIDKGNLARLSVSALVMEYSTADRKAFWGEKPNYQKEMAWITQHVKRQEYIKKLAGSLKGNTLVLFQFVEKHGKPLYEDLKKKYPDRNIYFVSGSVKADEREDIRRLVEKDTSAIIVASYGTFSTGVNIKNLHNVIFASPFKGKVRLLQSIGRTLRITKDKFTAKLYDIADNLKLGSRENFGLRHLAIRVELYAKEGHKYNIYNVQLD